MGDLACLNTLGCINGCMLENLHRWDKVAACAYICEMTAGYENEPFTDLIGCMMNQQCMEQYPQDGPCLGSNEEALQSVTKVTYTDYK